VHKFSSNQDKASAVLIDRICREELFHVEAGIKWFKYLCERNGEDPINEFHKIVPIYTPSKLIPPFNKEARKQTGLTEEWYMPLSRHSN